MLSSSVVRSYLFVISIQSRRRFDRSFQFGSSGQEWVEVRCWMRETHTFIVVGCELQCEDGVRRDRRCLLSGLSAAAAATVRPSVLLASSTAVACMNLLLLSEDERR